ncbi:MAG: hypothetical protein KDD92_12800 [Caldilineaceae bacterium]|nr:hypothetical protein [Caldilineaceae bacterium]
MTPLHNSMSLRRMGITALALCLPALLCAFILVSRARQANAAPQTPAAVTITVNSSGDPESSSTVKTCGYTSGVYNPASDGQCTLRRAIVEAGARPVEDRPIAIQFNLSGEDPGYDAGTDTWTVTVDDPLVLKPFSILEKTGQVTIDGATQPGGRSDGPKVYLSTNDNRLDVEMTDNVIRNLGFYGGGVIFLKEDGNLVENIVMGLTKDGQEIVLRTPGQPQRMAGGGVHMSSDNNTVRNSVIAGSYATAITIDGGDNNIIQSNAIGTRSDGTVPEVAEAIECLRSFSYDPENWYGGWGISLTGANNQIIENRIAGLHILQSENDTPPRAIESFGQGHLIQNNVIGLDSANAMVGTCGQGIKVAGSDTQVIDNVIVRSRADSEDAEPGAIFTSDSSPLFNRMTVRRNQVIDGPGEVYTFGQGIPDSLKLFNPAKVTSITDTSISGTSGDATEQISGPGVPSDCPNCIVDLYLDDLDDNQETLTYLGETQADENGDWFFPLSEPLPAGAAVRTGSTTTSSGVIGSYGSGMSTKISQLYIAPTSVSIDGPTGGDAGVEYTFTIVTEPLTAAEIYSYTVTINDEAPIMAVLASEAQLRKTWSSDGVKTIDVLVETSVGSATASHTITIGSGSGSTPTPDPSGTPQPTPDPSGTPQPTPSPVPSSMPQPTATPGSSSGDEDGVYLPVIRR